METDHDELWQNVEMALAWYCCGLESWAGPSFKCTCPKQSELEDAAPEALTALLTALEDKSYVGDWKKYLEP